MPDRLRRLWDFDDLDGSEHRFRGLFEAAFEDALAADLYYLAGDAAHMVAIADPDKMIGWTERGLALAADEPDAAYWAGPLQNNLGWHYFEAGDREAALIAFERALE